MFNTQKIIQNNNFNFDFLLGRTYDIENIYFLYHDIMVFVILIFILICYLIYRNYNLSKYNNIYLNHNFNHFNKIKNKYYNKEVIIELIWTTIPLLILLLISMISTAFIYNSMNYIYIPDHTLTITGHQWYWEYIYNNINLIVNSNIVHESSLSKGELRLLETDERVLLPSMSHLRMFVTSDDVIHSWSLPSLGIKIDANPGRLHHYHFFTGSNLGIYYGQCSELCGVGHESMPISIQTTPNWIFESTVDDSFLVYSPSEDAKDNSYFDIKNESQDFIAIHYKLLLMMEQNNDLSKIENIRYSRTMITDYLLKSCLKGFNIDLKHLIKTFENCFIYELNNCSGEDKIKLLESIRERNKEVKQIYDMFFETMSNNCNNEIINEMAHLINTKRQQHLDIIQFIENISDALKNLERTYISRICANKFSIDGIKYYTSFNSTELPYLDIESTAQLQRYILESLHDLQIAHNNVVRILLEEGYNLNQIDACREKCKSIPFNIFPMFDSSNLDNFHGIMEIPQNILFDPINKVKIYNMYIDEIIKNVYPESAHALEIYKKNPNVHYGNPSYYFIKYLISIKTPVYLYILISIFLTTR